MSKLGNWLGDRWGKGPSMKGLKSSVKGTGNFIAKTAPYAAGALLIPGVGSAIGGALGMGGGAAAGAGAAGAAGAGATAAKAGGLLGGLRSVGGLIKDNAGDLIKTGIGVGSAIQGYQKGQQADDLQREALDMAREAYADRAPLREMGLAGMTGAQRPDLSGIFGDAGNPYSRSGHIPSVGAGTTETPEQLALKAKYAPAKGLGGGAGALIGRLQTIQQGGTPSTIPAVGSAPLGGKRRMTEEAY